MYQVKQPLICISSVYFDVCLEFKNLTLAGPPLLAVTRKAKSMMSLPG